MSSKDFETASLVSALSQGAAIINSDFWKRTTLSSNYVVVFLVGGFEALKSAGIVDISISVDDLNAIYAGGAALLGIFNSVMAVITNHTLSFNPFK